MGRQVIVSLRFTAPTSESRMVENERFHQLNIMYFGDKQTLTFNYRKEPTASAAFGDN